MGLDITFTRRNKTVCPKCGEIVGHIDLASAHSSGRVWYPILEQFGYYVPYDQRTEENDWYGKDMELTPEQTYELFQFVRGHDVYNEHEVYGLIAVARCEDNILVINADW